MDGCNMFQCDISKRVSEKLAARMKDIATALEDAQIRAEKQGPYATAVQDPVTGQWRYIDSSGYVRLYPEKPNPRNFFKYEYEHRKVMAEKLKRDLAIAEIVHHLDGNRANNAAENLELITDHIAHMREKHPEWRQGLTGREKMASKPFAVFAISELGNGVAGTTRPKDRKSDDAGEDKIGLPGGKLDGDEDPISALKREAAEEGWKLHGISSDPVYKANVQGKEIWWYVADSATKLKTFKEKGRVTPVVRDAADFKGFGNPEALDAARRKYFRILTRAEKTAANKVRFNELFQQLKGI